MADAVLLLPPYYFASVPDQGIENFILAVLQKTQLPSYLYNYSVHTGNLVSTQSYKNVAEQLPLLRGIKCTVTAMTDATSYKETMPHLQVSLLRLEKIPLLISVMVLVVCVCETMTLTHWQLQPQVGNFALTVAAVMGFVCYVCKRHLLQKYAPVQLEHAWPWHHDST